ncbi:MAG: hypothetical protein Q9211_002895 [Gyalolechia sp. 1 TL-2023]
MAVAKPIRAVALASIFLVIFLVFQLFHRPLPLQGPRVVYSGMKTDPNLEETHEPAPAGQLWRPDDYAADNPNSPRINATILSLVRNEELDGMIQSMKDLERTWNHKFNYPWTFFNDVPFTDEFKQRTRAETKAQCNYELIPKEHWAIPSWINDDLFRESAKMLEEQDIQYGNLASYHQMCRWNSGLFYHHPALQDVRYYWRVEPKVHFFCDVDYDVFRYMQDHNKTYGFTINLYDDPKSIPTLWPETLKFIEAHPEYVQDATVSARAWLEDQEMRPEHNEKANGYSTCHFWSNFEIADMQFWRSRAYEDYFNHLDRAGGFFYERWGDAPVHSIALGLFEDASRIHWKGLFTDGEDFLFKEDCRPNWFKFVGMG